MAAVWDRHAKGDIQLIVDEMAVDKCNPECMQLNISLASNLMENGNMQLSLDGQSFEVQT